MRAAALALGLLAFPAPALAAYAPRLEVSVDPPAPDAAAALTATLRQEPGESANRREVVRFPRELRFNPGFAVTGCSRAAEEAEACPESSRIGSAAADTELGSFSGPVYLTEDFRTLLFLRGFGGLVQSKVEGAVRLNADGSVETVLDELPNVRTTYAQVRLDAGPRSLVLTPSRCGAYPVRGTFTSHAGEVAVSESTLRVSGCDTGPEISAVRVRARGRAIRVSWRLSEPGSATLVRVERRTAARPWQRWRPVASARGRGGSGRNALAVGRRLRPGLYRVTLTAFSARGRRADMVRHTVRLRSIR